MEHCFCQSENVRPLRQEEDVWDIQGKNPVIEIVPDEVIGKDMRENVDRSMKPTSDVTWGD